MDNFLRHDDELGRSINSASKQLFSQLSIVDVDQIGMPEHCLHYFKLSHSKRLFFSIETSAHLLYRSISLAAKPPADIVLMDYGAGVGTLYLLAKMIGCKKVVYSDHLEDWKTSAELVAKAIGVAIDMYIVGDVDVCLEELDAARIQCDIIASRNVLEHIYKLHQFYSAVYYKQPGAIIFSSTTANNSNPAVVIKHRLWHRKWEKVYRGKRMVTIERQSPGMSAFKRRKLAAATRGLAADDLKQAIDEFRKTGATPDPSDYGTNTCDPANGVWAENLLSQKTYRWLINENLFTIHFAAGFWDTHYKLPLMNFAAKVFNRIIAGGGRIAMWLAPFMYVIAIPKRRHE